MSGEERVWKKSQRSEGGGGKHAGSYDLLVRVATPDKGSRR